MNEMSAKDPNPNAAPGHGGDGASPDVVSRVAASAHQAVDRLAASVGPAVERLRGGTHSAVENVKSRADAFGAMEEQWISSARSYVRDHPLSAVAVGVLVGVLIGKMSGRDRD